MDQDCTLEEELLQSARSVDRDDFLCREIPLDDRYVQGLRIALKVKERVVYGQVGGYGVVCRDCCCQGQ